MRGVGLRSWVPPPHPQDPPSYLQHHGAELPLAVELPCASQDGGGLPGAGGAIEQEVGQPVLTDEPLDWEEGGTQGLGEGTGAWGTWGLMGLTGDWRTQGHGWEYGALGREGGRLWGYRGMGGIGDRRVHSGLGGHRGLGGGNGEGKRKVIGAWEGAWGLGGHRFGGVTGDWGQEGLEGHGGVQGLGGGVEVGGGTVARRAEGHGGGGQRGGRGCLDVGTRGGTELGGLQGLGEHGGSGAREGARGRGKEHEGWGGGTGRGGGTGGSEHPLRGVPPLTGAEDVPVRHQLRQRPRTVLLHPAGHSAQRGRGPTPTPAARPAPPARPRPRTTAGSSRTAPPWPRARAASREGRERGNGGEGAGPGGGGAREPGLGARERGGAPPVAGARRCGRAELRAELRSELGSARSGVSSRGCCQHHSHFGSLHPHSVFLVPAYRRVAQRWQQPLPPPLQHWARGGSVLTALQGEQPG